jgi:hypothetical protein
VQAKLFSALITTFMWFLIGIIWWGRGKGCNCPSIFILQFFSSESCQIFLTWLLHQLKVSNTHGQFAPPSVNSQVMPIRLLLPRCYTYQYCAEWLVDTDETLTRKSTFYHCTALPIVANSVAPLPTMIQPAQYSVQQINPLRSLTY